MYRRGVVKVVVVASGSTGNATLFESGGTRVLVDAGIGPYTLLRRLRALAGANGGTADADLKPHAVVLTHAHGDHAAHCQVVARRFGIPLYVSEGTRRELALERSDVQVFGTRDPFAIGALTVAPMPLPHDAAQVAFVVTDGTRSAGIATDLGEVPAALPEHFAHCDVLLVESNYDPFILDAGPYLPHLKRRVASARGHLSNPQLAELLRRLPKATHTVVLLHVSQTNNRRDIALETAKDALSWRNVTLHVAAADEPLAIDAAAPPPREPIRTKNTKPVQLALF